MKVIISKQTVAERILSTEPGKHHLFTSIDDLGVSVSALFEHQYISDIIDYDTVRGWDDKGYFIISQPSTGKTTLIVDIVIRIAMERNKKVLIILPRSALDLQYKKEIANKYQPEVITRYTPDGLHNLKSIGSVDIVKMQDLANPNILADYCMRVKSSYEFIVFDEVHAFVGDASFNMTTYTVIHEILKNAEIRTKRIYLTATPDIVLGEISELENEIGNKRTIYNPYSNSFISDPLPNLTVYRFENSYEFVRLGFFHGPTDIRRIIQSISEDERALVFVSSKSQGKQLEYDIGSDLSLFIDATSKANEYKAEYEDIIETSNYKQKILIVTRFLDVGVNLKDGSIKHVFLNGYYKEDIIQMMGRRRPSQSNDDKFNLYLRMPTLKELRKERERLIEENLNMQKLAFYFPVSSETYEYIPRPYSLIKKGLKLNLIENKYCSAINSYHIIQIDKMIEGCSSDIQVEDNYHNLVSLWFPNSYELESSINCGSDAAKESVMALLSNYENTEINTETYAELCDRIFEILKVKRRNSEKGSAATNKLKVTFNKHAIPYHFKSLSKNGCKGKYLLEKGEWT